MSAPLRIQALVLPVGSVSPVEKLYRWALGMKPAEEGEGWLGWGSEDRVRLEDAPAATAAGLPEPEEAVVLRMPGMPLPEAAAWLAERDLAPVAAAVPPADEAAAREAWPSAPIERIESDELANRVIVSVAGPAPPRVDLFFPVPRETVVGRGGMGPFLWRSGDRKGLEIPGLLGVTTGAPDPAAERAFLTRLGLGEMEPDGPLAVGDHQWVIERRDPPGIYGWAMAMPDAKVKDLARTMEHLGADHRLDQNRLLAVDPAGRVVLVHGVRSA